MRFNILKKVNGSGSTAPKNKFAYLAHINDIQSFPKADHKGVALVDDIVMKEKTGMAQIYITPAAQEYSYETIGDSDSKSFKLKFLGTHPGTELEALEFVKNYLEEDFVILIPSCEIGLKVLGTPDAPLRFTSSHKSDKDSQKFNFTFEQEIGTENVYQLYTGLVTLNENIDVDMEDFLEHLKSYMKLDGSNLSEAQKQNLRTILGSDGKNLGNSDLSLEQNRSFNLGSYFLNFFSNVGAKIGINKNNPTQALDVVGNVKSDAFILNDEGDSDVVGTVKRNGNEIKFKTSSGWETIMLKGDYVSDSHGIISPDTPEPLDGWKIGWYTPKVSSAEPGTNYPNQNDLKSVEGYFTEFYFDGTSWEDVSRIMENNIEINVDGGVMSFEVGKGQNPIPSGSTIPQWVKKNPTLASGYYTYNSNTGLIGNVSGNTFMKTSFTAMAGERIRVKIGNFYIQNNGNGINPICIYIENSAGSVLYYSKGEAESGLSVPSGDAATGTFEFERDINVDSTIYVCADYSTPILDIYVRENVIIGEHFVLNTSKADKPGGYVSFDGYTPGQIINPYKDKKHAILGDSLSEDPPAGQAPTTDKYWYQFLQEDLQLNYKTYAVSGNTWGDMYNQALQAKVDSDAGTQLFNLFTLFAGTNDFYFNVPIGEFYTTAGGIRTLSMDNSTFKGRINRLLNYMKRNFPTLPINMFNILHRGAAHGTPSELTANGIGVFLDEYSKAIDEAGKLWGIPVIDIRGESGLYPVVPEALQYYTSANDYLHLSRIGHEKLKNYYKAKLQTLPI